MLIKQHILFNMCLLVAFSIPAANAVPVTFSDGDFLSGWTDVVFITDDPRQPGPGPGTASGNVSLQLSGGNPGSFRRSTHNIVFGDNIFTGGVNTNAVYDPSPLGAAISTIDFNTDLLQESLGGSSGWQLLLEQAGVRYYSVPIQAFSNSVWQTFNLSGLTFSNFDTNPNVGIPGAVPNNQHPDFTASAAPITFGYLLGNGLTGPGTLTVNLRVDNWSVTVNPTVNPTPVPEPSTLALFGISALGLYSYRWQRRKL